MSSTRPAKALSRPGRIWPGLLSIALLSGAALSAPSTDAEDRAAASTEAVQRLGRDMESVVSQALKDLDESVAQGREASQAFHEHREVWLLEIEAIRKAVDALRGQVEFAQRNLRIDPKACSEAIDNAKRLAKAVEGRIQVLRLALRDTSARASMRARLASVAAGSAEQRLAEAAVAKALFKTRIQEGLLEQRDPVLLETVRAQDAITRAARATSEAQQGDEGKTGTD
ncbi:hypothetical protein ACFLSJ_03570 [Verrucomicrobiota bacterium]